MADVELLTRDRDTGFAFRLAEVLGQGRLELGGGVGEQHAVLRTLRTGQRRQDGAEVKFQAVGEDRIRIAGLDPHPLRLGVGFDQVGAMGLTAGGAQIVDGGLGHREEAAGGAVFRSHVGDGRLVFQGQAREAGTEELDELADDALLAEHLGDGQHQVGGGRAVRHRARQAEADDFRDQHRDRLAQHGRFSFDAADAPAQDGQAVDHGGVAVGADDGVGIGDGFAGFLVQPDGLGEVLQVHLVADAGAGRHDAEVVEGRGAPAQEAVTLDVALILALDVLAEGLGGAEVVDHDRVVDDQVDGVQRVDLFRIGAEAGHGVAHGGQVDDGRNAGEVLHQHAGRTEADLVLDRALVVEPGGQRLQIVGADGGAIFVTQQVLEKHLHRDGQTRHVRKTGFLRGAKAVVDVGLIAHRKFAAGLQAVVRRHIRDPSSVRGRS